MDLNTPVEAYGKMLKLRARLLSRIDIKTLEDLLYHAPFRYEDFGLLSKIGNLQPGEVVTIRGEVAEIKNAYLKKGLVLQKALVKDESGTINIIWFNQPFLIRIIKQGEKISLSGKVETFNNKLHLESPQYEIINRSFSENLIHTGRIVGIYPETKGLSSKWLRRQIYNLLNQKRVEIVDYLPQRVLSNNSLMPLRKAFCQIHFPDSTDLAQKARQRLAFDELFLYQLKALRKRKEWKRQIKGTLFKISQFKKKIDEFILKLPFTLTNSQKKAVEEILEDLSKPAAMNRLLEGDVGSGKTVVAAIAMYLCYLNGYKSVFMAPTEILARQHYETINRLLADFGVKTSLLTGANKLNSRDRDFNILVGTHAVFSKNLQYENLGLAIVDEQHRFGVEQRALIRKKGKNPHFLTMTATPIPRTVALTLYGNLDLSVLDELPEGRKTVKTWVVPDEKRNSAYAWIKEQISKQGIQAFIICPFIEESENMATIKAAKKEFDFLKKEAFSGFRIGLLHGKLKSGEKDKVLKDFSAGKYDILVATPVVEVGIDIPNATIMLIEEAQRFGLAQLHQLRGRVGRSEKQSYCLLFTSTKTNQSTKRLRLLENIYNGARLSEMDLKLRGSGEIYGTAQHGEKMLKIASFSDAPLINKARAEAERIFPFLDNFPKLKQKIDELSVKNISPD